MVFEAVRELAVIRGGGKQEMLDATLEASRVIDGARTATQALSQRYEENQAKAAERRQKRSAKELQEMRKRLNVV